jgi:hypothetical protein
MIFYNFISYCISSKIKLFLKTISMRCLLIMLFLRASNATTKADCDNIKVFPKAAGFENLPLYSSQCLSGTYSYGK